MARLVRILSSVVALTLVVGVSPVAARKGPPSMPAGHGRLKPEHRPGIMGTVRLDPHRHAPTAVEAPAWRSARRALRPASATITVQYTGFSSAAKAAFQSAVDWWANSISSPVPIVVKATWSPLPGTILGQAGPHDFWRNQPGLVPGVWYPIPLANKLTGVDLEPGQPDIEATFDSDSPWDYGLDSTVPANKVNLRSVVLHELGHGLGFLGTMRRNNSTGTGTWGFSDASPSIFDCMATDSSGYPLVNRGQGSLALGSRLIANNARFRLNSNALIPLYAPSSFKAGSSFSHLDETTYPQGNANSLMTPSIRFGEYVGRAGLALTMLRQMGWGTTHNGGTCEDRHDISADRTPDIIARAADGGLWIYPTSGLGGILPGARVSSGWNFFDLLFMTPDVTGDHVADMIGRGAADGTLYLYPGNGIGGFGAVRILTAGWSGLNLILAPGDWSGDGRADLIGRGPDGTLWLYTGNAAGGFGAALAIGSGWNTFTAIMAPGDWSGDGKADLIARRSDGTLWLYRGNGASHFISPYPQIGSGWNAFNRLFTPGDFNGDGLMDIIGRRSDGSLSLYRGNGASHFISPYPKVGSGWSGFTVID